MTAPKDTDTSSGLDRIETVSLRETVHRALRQAILSGRFKPGAKLNERGLADQLGVSTTPVKEALRQVESDGLVETLPRRGVVIRFDHDWAEEMILARAALESTIARLAARRITPPDAQALEEIVARMRAATTEGDPEALVGLNEVFHDRIHAIARVQYLRMQIDRQQVYDSGARRVIHLDPKERERAYAEHAAIADAILAGDHERAERTMRDHVMRAGEVYLARVFTNEEQGTTK